MVVVSVDGSIGLDACDNCVEVKEVVDVVDDGDVVAGSVGDPHITSSSPSNPPYYEIRVKRVIIF